MLLDLLYLQASSINSKKRVLGIGRGWASHGAGLQSPLVTAIISRKFEHILKKLQQFLYFVCVWL